MIAEKQREKKQREKGEQETAQKKSPGHKGEQLGEAKYGDGAADAKLKDREGEHGCKWSDSKPGHGEGVRG